jgi:hypothetical protein
MKNNENSLDDFLIHPERATFSISHGKNFRNGPMFLGYLLLAIGLLVCGWVLNIAFDPNVYFKVLYAPYLFFAVGFGFLYGGGFITFSSAGVDVDVPNKQIREYSKFLRKKGSWMSIEKYPFVAVLKLQKNITYGMATPIGAYMPSREDENREHEICLLNQTHYKRITVDISTNYHVAVEKAEKLAQHLGLTYTQFNPVKISDRKRR